jgi:hypothetical protein
LGSLVISIVAPAGKMLAIRLAELAYSLRTSFLRWQLGGSGLPNVAAATLSLCPPPVLQPALCHGHRLAAGGCSLRPFITAGCKRNEKKTVRKYKGHNEGKWNDLHDDHVLRRQKDRLF